MGLPTMRGNQYCCSAAFTTSWRLPLGDIGTTSPPISSNRSSSRMMPLATIASISATLHRRRGKALGGLRRGGKGDGAEVFVHCFKTYHDATSPRNRST